MEDAPNCTKCSLKGFCDDQRQEVAAQHCRAGIEYDPDSNSLMYPSLYRRQVPRFPSERRV